MILSLPVPVWLLLQKITGTRTFYVRVLRQNGHNKIRRKSNADVQPPTTTATTTTTLTTMIRHRQGKTDAGNGSLLPVSSPEVQHGDAGKAGNSSKASSARRRKIRSKRRGSSGWSCCLCLCGLPLVLMVALVFYAKSQLPHQQEGVPPNKLMALYSKMEPYLSTSSATTVGRLLEHDPHLEQIFQAAKPVELTINDKKESIYVAFLTIRDASLTTSSSQSSSSSSSPLHSPYKVFQGQSSLSARDALHQALSHMGVLPILARTKWIHLEFVDSVTSLQYWNYEEPIPQEPESWWYGLSIPTLGENTTFTFTPSELFTHALVDSRGYLRWDHIWNLVEKKGRQGLRRHPYTPLEHLGVTTDDATILPQLDLFTSHAYFGEVVTSPSSHALEVSWVPLMHGHRMYSAEAMVSSVQSGIGNAIRYWLANVVQDDGSMIYAYHPRSNLVKQPRGSDEALDYHYMTRHMGTLFAMSQWLLTQPTHEHDSHEQQTLVALVHEAVSKGLDFILSKALHKDCPIPLNPDIKARCMVEVAHLDFSAKIATTTRIDLNALTVLALTEYIKVLTSASTATVHDHIEAQIEQYWNAAVDLSIWIAGAQRDDGSLVQKVTLKPSLELDQSYFVHYFPGLTAFAMARLYTVTDHLRKGSELVHPKAAADATARKLVHKEMVAMLPKEEDQQTWFDVAAKTAQVAVAEEQDKKRGDGDFVHDHWLLNALAELQVAMKEQNKMVPGSLVEYVHHAIQVLRKYQSTSAEVQDHHKKNLDRVGIFYDDISASATALKVNGLCSVYDWMDTENRNHILEMVEAGVRYQLQAQYGPELAMFLPNPHSVLGGFRESIMSTELRVDYIQYNLESLMCMERILKDHAK